ncbi:MAG: aminodeoxychorismate synthase component I [Xanthomonadales bacterium]|nr:aminodeoxychorismate synthase component I [Xanthomonadales bacterium]
MAIVSGYGRIELPYRPDWAARLAALHAADPRRFPALLASQSSGTPRARRDLLLIGNGEGFQGGAGRPVCDLAGNPLATTSFLDALSRCWRETRETTVMNGEPCASLATALPAVFRGGWLLLLGYELAAEIEPKLRLPDNGDGTPAGLALRCPAAIVLDRREKYCVLIHELTEAARSLAQIVLEQLEGSNDPVALPPSVPGFDIEEDEPTRFTGGVRRLLDYLAAGDAFQVNLSRGWRLRPQLPEGEALDVAALYRSLAGANPAPFAASLRGPGFHLLSSSPERLVAVRGSRVETRPIAGTRPRVPGDDDAGRIAELVGHPKERAEHIMLIDLERNDLGRICRPGTVKVEELMAVESYAHVHHIESTVAGELRDDVEPVDVIRALFPGGTITGCPKVRCMEIIAELEGVGRGAYTGAIGYLNHDGDMDLNILIRSLVWDGEALHLRAGAGIVADSDPDAELAETRAKARGLLHGLGITNA